MPSITGAIIGGTSLLGAGISGSAASSAASGQQAAEEQAAELMHQQYLQTRSDLLPYNTYGQTAAGDIAKMGNFNFNPTQAQLEKTPGYQFNLSQGLKATQNSAAARGLGVSGAALKGAGAYASGLADTTYQNQFNNALTTYGTNLSRLQQQAGLGENAAAQTGNYGTQTAANIGSTIVGAANAGAAGQIGVANAFNNGLSGLGSALLYSQGGGGGLYGQGAASGQGWGTAAGNNW